MRLRSFMRVLIVTAMLGSASWALAAPANEPRALLITGLGTTDPSHPQHPLSHRFYNDRIVEILDGIVAVTVTEDLSIFNDAALSSYDIVLNNSFLLEPTPKQLEALYRFIEQGKPYLALHAGLVSFVDSDRYGRMMGGRVAGHSSVKTFTVDTFEEHYGAERMVAHPISRGLAPFTTRDEIYVVQTNTEDLEVIVRAEAHPIVLLRRWGNGQVMAFTLGHADYSMESAGYQTLLQNSVRWLVNQPIMEPLRGGVFPVDSPPIDDYIDLNERTHHRNDSPLTYSQVANTHPELVTATIDADNRIDLRFAPGRHGTAVIRVQAQDPTGRTDSSELEITVRERGDANLSVYHGVKAHSSSSERRPSAADPNRVRDGDPSTRWSSDHVDASWIYVDLGDAYTVNRVRLVWEAAHARKYELQVSNDAQNWTTVRVQQDGKGGTEELRFKPANARYVRMLGRQRATHYGYSLYEFEVYGNEVRQATPPHE